MSLVSKYGIDPLATICHSIREDYLSFRSTAMLVFFFVEVLMFSMRKQLGLIRGLVGTFSYQLCRKLQIKVVTTILHFSAALKASNTKKRLSLTAVGGFQQLGTIPVNGLSHCGSMQQSIKSLKVSDAIQPQLKKLYILARKTNIIRLPENADQERFECVEDKTGYKGVKMNRGFR